jgi:hypothetical protein
MEAGMVMNRALQLRAVEALRRRLGCPLPGCLPEVEMLVECDVEQLREIGGGRLGAVAIVASDAASRDAVTGLVEANVRGTDLLLTHTDDTLLVLTPGLDPIGGQSLVARLEALLSEQFPHTPAVLGAAYRSPLSLHGWRPTDLASEARRRALTTPDDLEHVA